MVGGLVFSQTQHQLIIAPRRSGAAAQVSEQHPTPAPPFTASLRHVGSMDDFRKVHAQYVKLGLDAAPRGARELLAACALADWGSMDYAASLFSALDEPEAFNFNTMMRGYVKGGCDPEAALQVYVDMLETDVRPDNYTFPLVLKACAQLSAIQEGKQVHGHAAKLGFQCDVFTQNSLVNLYGKCGDTKLARRAFAQLGGEWTVASWSSLLAAYTRAGLWGECLEFFGMMMAEGCRPDESSMVCTVSSCAHLGAYDLGRSVHCLLLRNTARLNAIMQTALIDMYAKCGCLAKAHTVFNGMSEKNVWTYSAMISAMALHGEGKRALQLFSAMLREGHRPDEAVYVGILNACSRAGLLDEGFQYFDRMRLEHKITPTSQHYGCMVDLMSRAGKLEEALGLIRSMPMGPTDSAWRSLLHACKMHGNLELAEHAVEQLTHLGAVNTGDYILLADMHAKAKSWDDVARIRTAAVDRGLVQVPGFSAVEVKGRMHRFVSQDRSHPRSHDIYEMLHQMEWQLRFEQYSPDTSDVSLDVDEEEKRRVVAAHSQKLAMAFGLLSTGEGATIRIITNLRMSKECHAYTALISMVFSREIVVRDRNRFHRFRQGACSCGNYW